MERMERMEAKTILWKALKYGMRGALYVAEKYPLGCYVSIISIVIYAFLPTLFFIPFIAALAYIFIFPRTHSIIPPNYLSQSDLLVLNPSASSSDDGLPSPKPSAWTDDDARNLMHLGHSDLERNRRLETLIARRRSKKFLKMNTLLDRAITDPTKTDAPTPREDQPPGSAPSLLHPLRNPFDLPYDPSEEKPDLAADAFQKEFTLSRAISATDLVSVDAPHPSAAGASMNDGETSGFRFPDSLPCPIPRAANVHENSSSEERGRQDGSLLNALINSHRSCNSIASDMQVEVSDTGSPPFTVDGSGSSSDGNSCKYDGDVSSGSDDAWGASPPAPPCNVISCATQGNSSSETGTPADGEMLSALDFVEAVNPFGKSDEEPTKSHEHEVIEQDNSRSCSSDSVLQPSGAQTNGRTPPDPKEHMTLFDSESDVEEREVTNSLMEVPVSGSESPPLTQTPFPEKKDGPEASNSDDNGEDIDQTTNHDEVET